MDLKLEAGCDPVRRDPGAAASARGAVLAGALVAGTLLTLSAVGARAETKAAFWHAMSGELGRQLDRLVADFNGSQTESKIVATNKGSYTQAVTSAIFAVRTHAQPAIVQVNEIATATMMAAR